MNEDPQRERSARKAISSDAAKGKGDGLIRVPRVPIDREAESRLEYQDLRTGAGDRITVRDEIEGLRDELRRYYATKEDLERAKMWVIRGTIGLIFGLSPIVAAALLAYRLFA